MSDESRPQSDLFTYGTDISLRGPERRHGRLPVVVMVLLTAAVAAAVLSGVLWVASADFAALLPSLRDFLLGATANV